MTRAKTGTGMNGLFWCMSLVLSDATFLEKWRDVLVPSSLEKGPLRFLLAAALEHWDLYHKCMDYNAYLYWVDNGVEDEDLHSDYLQIYADVSAAYTITTSSMDTAWKAAEEWIQDFHIGLALDRARASLVNGDRESVFAELLNLRDVTGVERLSVQASEVEDEPLRWLWYGRILRGQLTLLVGDPTTGKSLLSCDIAARVSNGGRWPDDEEDEASREPGWGFILSAEDGAADTLRPRLQHQKADLHRVELVDAQTYANFAGKDGISNLERRIQDLQKKHVGPGIVFLDPLDVFIDGRDSYKSSDVRKALAPVEACAQRTGAAVVGIMHLNKRSTEPNTLYRVLGSHAYVAAARSVLLAGFEPDSDSDPHRRRALASLKGNLTDQMPALSYVIHGSNPGCLVWNGQSNTTAEDLMQAPKSRAPKRDKARVWLESSLAGGPKKVTELQEEVRSVSIAWKTLERAAAELKVMKNERRDAEGRNYWEWQLAE